MNKNRLEFTFLFGVLAMAALVPTTFSMGFAQSNQTSSSSSGGSSEGSGELALMALDLNEIESSIQEANEALMNAETLDALNILGELENLMSIIDKEPKLLQDIKSISDSISNDDLTKATEELTKIQNEISVVKNTNPEIVNNNDDDD